MFNNQQLVKIKVPILIIALILGFIACQEDQNPTPSPILEEDVFQAVKGAILPNSGGLISQIDATANIGATAINLGCEVQNDSTLNQVVDNRNSYSYTWKLENTCDLDNFPFELTSKLDGNRRYLVEDLSANEKVESNIYLSGLSNSEEFTTSLITEIEGSYRAGNDILDGYVGKISLVGIDIIINKDTKRISSGNADFIFSGASISGSFFNFKGIISFKGGNTADMIFENGGTYSFNW